MKNEDKEAFEDYMSENKSIYLGMPEWEVDTDRAIWQAACEFKQKEIDELEERLWQAKGALGYPVPGNIPEGDFHCGLCESKARRMIELEAHKTALVELIRIMMEAR